MDRIDKKYFLHGFILLGTFLFCYIQAISQLFSFWKNSYVYSYGFLIPAISMYLVWINRKKLNDIDLSPSYIGGLLVFFTGILMFVFGNRSSVLVIQSLSIVITISGIVLFIYGKKFFSGLLFPIAYLLFMIPIWDILTERLQFPFQNFTALSASKLLQVAGVPVYRESIFLELPNITLEVATVCSGINNLIAVLAIALPLAYLSLKSWPRRILLVTGGIAIAALSNGLRVAIMGFLSYKGITITLHGPGHILQAMFVSFVGFIVLFIGAWILSDRHSKSAISSESENKERFRTSRNDRPATECGLIYELLSNRLLYLTAGILFITGMYINFYSPSPVPLKSDLKFFPYEIGSYQGTDVSVDNKLNEMFDTNNAVARVYRTDSGGEMNLYIGYLESQEQGKELVNYKSAEFHNAASREKILTDKSGTFEINKVISQKNGAEKVIYFWYDLNGHIIADRYCAKVRTVLDSLINRRTNGAIVMVSADIPDAGDSEKVFKDTEDFIRVLLPVLQGYLP
ncbi:MAG: exosortase W [Thermodesulfovibrionales bacterium]